MLTDVGLGLGVLCSAIAAFAFYIDKYSGMKFQDLINITTGLVAVYFVVYLIHILFSRFIDKNIVFVGVNDKGEKLKVSSNVSKNVPIYELELQIGDAEPVKKSIEFNQVYTVNGFLKFDKLYALLEDEIKTMIDKKK